MRTHHERQEARRHEGAGCARLRSVWGRRKQPVINVGWDEVRQYVK